MTLDTELTTMTSGVALLEAIEHEQLTLLYQGIYPAHGAEPTGFEALIRWDHPTLGLLGPAQFLPSDMGCGIGRTMTSFVLEQAVGQCATWRRGGLDVGISVNVAPEGLDQALTAQVATVLERHQLAPEMLTIEITEKGCVGGPHGMARALVSLAKLGVRLSLDDFGTGESSLARLQHLPFDEMKIDQCFVRDAAWISTDRNIVGFVTQLAHSLGMTVVAEGIEDHTCLDAITHLGVERAQGFFLHRPASAASIEEGRVALC